jgi:hypothetical protein
MDPHLVEPLGHVLAGIGMNWWLPRARAVYDHERRRGDMKRKLAALTAMCITGGIACSAPLIASATPVSACGPAHIASGKHSLNWMGATYGWSYYGRAEGVSHILMNTLTCNGGTFPVFLRFYLDDGDLNANVYKGTRLWFRAPGPADPFIAPPRDMGK